VERDTDDVNAIGNHAICNCAKLYYQYDLILPLYQLGYQPIPLVKLKDIHGIHDFLGTLSDVVSASSGVKVQLLQLWNVPSMNGDSALMSWLPCLHGVSSLFW